MKCEYCDSGVPIEGEKHVMVVSILPVERKSFNCKKIRKNCKECGLRNCQCEAV